MNEKQTLGIREKTIKSKKDGSEFTAYEIFHLATNESIKLVFFDYKEQQILRALNLVKK